MAGVAILRVLDERGRVDVSVGQHGESARTVREKVETARALESLPEVAAAAHAGRLSDEQLVEVAKLADESSGAEWAQRAPDVTSADLGRLARKSNRAMVASVHHPLLITHGPYALVGNPNRPDGLRMKHVQDLTPAEERRSGSHHHERDRVPHEPHDSCSPRCDDVRPRGRTLPSCAGAGRSPS